MREAQIVYNPSAGDGKHSRNQIIELVKNAGYKFYYCSTKDENWEASLIKNPEIIYAAGGDGTIQKVAEAILSNKDIDRETPIQILPLGTANNIAKTFGLVNRSISEIIKNKATIKNFDYGKITGLATERFFIESFGLGIFPNVILKMKNEENDRTPAEKLRHTYIIFKQLIATYKPTETIIKIDGETIKDSFLMAEIMNIKYLGPNLELSPNASPSDSFFNLVLIKEESRKIFSRYIDNLMNGRDNQLDIKQFTETRRIKKFSLFTKGSNLHVDDEVIRNPPSGEIMVENKPGTFKMRFPS